jgi:hypothetical protein
MLDPMRGNSGTDPIAKVLEGRRNSFHATSTVSDAERDRDRDPDIVEDGQEDRCDKLVPDSLSSVQHQAVRLAIRQDSICLCPAISIRQD